MQDTALAVMDCRETATSREDFIDQMKSRGYGVDLEHFYKLGGKVLLLDQAHKYPEWDKELRACYDAFPDLQIIFMHLLQI